MMDEYERAAEELKVIVHSLDAESYELLRDANTQDENCQSIQTILSHVVSSGYSYANYLRSHFGVACTPRKHRLLSFEEAVPELTGMLQYTVETLENHWELSDDELMNVRIDSRWGQKYDIEQLLEHAIVHILRHRRQLDKFLS